MGKRILPLLVLLAALWSCETWDMSDPRVRGALVEPVNRGDYLIRVRDREYPYLRDMLLTAEPDARMAALLLVEYNLSSYWYPYLLEATLDSNRSVAEKAREILIEVKRDFLPWATKNLYEMDYEILLPSLDLLVSLEYGESVDELIRLFERGSKAITRSAADALSSFVSYDAAKIQELKDHENPLYRQGYYQTLASYRNSGLIPLILHGLEDQDTQVWAVTVSSLYSFGADLVPYLQEMIDTGDYRMSLAVLQILEQARMREGIPLLVELCGSPHQIIAQRSMIQLQTYGLDALSVMKEYSPRASESQIQAFLWILERIDHSKVIEVYVEIMKREIPRFRQEVFQGLSHWDTQAWEWLRPLMLSSEAPLNGLILDFLRDSGDPQLLMDQSGRINRDRAYILLQSSSMEEISLYVEQAGLPLRYTSELKTLKETLQIARNYRGALEQLQVQREGFYTFYQRWESLQIQAEQKVSQSRESNRIYFDTGDVEALERSRQYREEAEALREEAQGLKRRLEGLRNSDSQGYNLYREMLNYRSQLVDIWENLSPSFRDLGNLVFRQWGLDGEELQRLQRLQE